MLVTPIDHGLTYIGKSTGARSTGLHMSDLYNGYFQDLEPHKYDKSKPMNPMHLEMGLAWENMLEDGLKERLTATTSGEEIQRPGEFVTDGGIAFSPDLLIYAEVPPVRLGEIKLTWMSSREMPKEPQDFSLPKRFRKWEMQIMAYLFHLEMLHARLYSFHVNGEYAWMKKTPKAQSARAAVSKVVEETNTPTGPQLLAFNLEYTEIELGDNWQILESYGKSAGLLDSKGRAIRRRKK